MNIFLITVAAILAVLTLAVIGLIIYVLRFFRETDRRSKELRKSNRCF